MSHMVTNPLSKLITINIYQTLFRSIVLYGLLVHIISCNGPLYLDTSIY